MRGVKIWLDDVRPAPSGWIHAKNYKEFWFAIHEHLREISAISLDHDLGEQKTGYDAVCLLETLASGGTLPRVNLRAHSANPVGVQKILAAFDSIERLWKEQGL